MYLVKFEAGEVDLGKETAWKTGSKSKQGGESTCSGSGAVSFAAQENHPTGKSFLID